MVGAAPAMEFVITVPTVKPVRTAITPDPIIGVRTSDILDVDEVVGLGEVGVNRVIARDEGRRLSARQVDVKSDQAGNVPRHNVVKVGYGVVAAAAVDEVAAHTGFDIVFASAGKDDVVSAITVDEIGGTVGPEERFGFAGSFDNSHGRAPSWLE